MLPILTYDKELGFPDFTIVSASAGSGKTHTLTLKLLQILLSGWVPENRLNNVLAMTFTRNAAAEMRQRVLEYLKKCYHGKPEILSQLSECVAMDEDRIRARCGELIDIILKDYSSFQVQTIDSFMSRIFRASALEFGFSPVLETETESKRLLDDAFEQFARELIADPSKQHFLEELTDLITENSQITSRYAWNPYQKLSAEVRELYNKINALAKELLPPNNESNVLPDLRKNILVKLNKLSSLVKESGLEPTKNFETVLDAARIESIDDLIVRKSLYNFPVKRSGSAKIKQLAEKWSTRFTSLQEEMKELAFDYVTRQAYSYYRPYVEAYRMLRDTLERTMRRTGRIFLSDISRKLITYISQETVPQIYYYLGDSVYHYLIDEFQDTSPAQWKTIEPLVSEALSKQGSLFIVGDTKQSIYAFRQADWRIMKTLMEENVFPSAPRKIKELNMNYRSQERILDFSNEVFHKIIPQEVVGEAPHISGLSKYHQVVKEENRKKGYVEVASFEADEEPNPEREKILEIVRDCVNRGHRYGDIMILAQQNKYVVAVSEWLNSAHIAFISHSSLDIRGRSIIGELIALLRFLDSPIDDLSFASFLLGKVFRSKLESDNIEIPCTELNDFILQANVSYKSPPLYTAFRKKYPRIWKNYFDSLFNVVGYLPMYDLVSEVYKQFRIFTLIPEEQSSLIKFMEVMKNFEKTGQNTLKNFLAYTEEEGDNNEWNIAVPPGEDAVSVMTIHKAKGLDRQVVIVLLVDTKPRADNLFFEKEEEGIRLLRITKVNAGISELLSGLYEKYRLERTVDDLNKLYVAFTRAKEEMYIISVKSTTSDDPSKYLPRTGYEPSKKPIVEIKERYTEKVAELYHSVVQVPLEETSLEKLALYERQRGEAIHAVLAKVINKGVEIENDLSSIIKEISGEWPEQINGDEIKRLVFEFLKLPEIEPFFIEKEGRAVLNEQEFVSSGGKLLRMDRIVADTGNVTVLDFKSGEDKKDYDIQLREYMEVLGDIYPGRIISGILAFVDRKKIRVVE